MTYFVSKRKSTSEPFRIVYREVKTHTSKGYPLTYELKALPEEFQTWEEAMAATERLNAGKSKSGYAGGQEPSWP
jgi:hypothetical protein